MSGPYLELQSAGGVRRVRVPGRRFAGSVLSSSVQRHFRTRGPPLFGDAFRRTIVPRLDWDGSDDYDPLVRGTK